MEKRSEEALRESEGRIQAILDTAADAIITIDQLGIIENVNHAAERLFGYSASELIGRNVSMLMPAPHHERHDEYLAHYMRTGEAKVIGIGRELEALRSDGTNFPIELALSEVRGVNHRQFTGVIRDITARKRAEEALRESQSRVHAILDAAADAIITIDQRGIIESANPAVERLFGYPPSELLGRNVSMLMPSPHREQHDEYLARYIRTGEARVIGIGRELEALRRDGTTFPIELALSEVRGSGHRQFTGIIRDITVRQKAEEALRESQGRIQALLNTAADAIITINQRGIVEAVNTAGERLFGYTASELIGRNVSMLMPSPYRDQHDGYLERYICTGEARVIGIGRELEATRRDGTTFPIELALSEVRGSSHRQFTGIIRDITARKKAEEALRESQGRIQAILNTAADAIITIDQRGIVESVNTAAERLFGYSASDVIGHNVSMLMPSPHREQHDGYLERYMRTGEAKVIGIGRELEAMRCDGSTFPIELAPSEVVGSNHRQFTGIIRDITVRKRAEAALLRADALKDEFLANTSHELRTPLNGIIGIGQSMLDGATGNLTEDQRRNLAMVVASGRRLASLVNDLLDFSKLRHETLELRRRPTDMHALTDLVLTVSRALVGKRPVRLFNRVDPHVPLVEVDDDRIQQVLFNLVGNGIKFTPGGAVEVSARARDSWLDVTVADTGIGIDGSRFDEIFESFSQGDGTAAREQGGTGLGLAITKQLVELHGGKISVESEVGSGSKFTFWVPLSATTRAMLTPDEAKQPVSKVLADVHLTESSVPAAAQTSHGRYHILVVDDEPVNVQALVNYLNLANYTVVTTASGHEALEYLSSDKPCDLVLLDVMMPRLSGFEVCEKIRESYSHADLPVILLTAKNRVSDLVSGFSAGANDYLTKPFASDELLARVNVHLELAKISDSYARFVPRQFLEQLGKERIIDVVLGDQVQREMTVLFSDIRDFTHLAEGMSPAETFRFVNEYLGAMEPAIASHHGVVDKYVGDAVMALFPSRADDAVRAALEMFQRLEGLNHERAKLNGTPVHVGIGLHTGKLMLGTVGARDRMDTTVISDAVNLASRVENLTKAYRVPLIITEDTYTALQEPNAIAFRRIDRVLVQGKSQPIVLYEVLDADDPARRAAKQGAMPDFEAGLVYYEALDFTRAIGHFERALAAAPSDTVAQVLLERVRRFASVGSSPTEEDVFRIAKVDH